jgi:hypothetical protein
VTAKISGILIYRLICQSYVCANRHKEYSRHECSIVVSSVQADEYINNLIKELESREKTFQSLSKPTINLDIDQKYPGFFTKESFNDCTEEDICRIKQKVQELGIQKTVLPPYIHKQRETFPRAYKTERYNIKGKDVVAGNCKYYLNDLSFKNFLYPGFAYGVGYLLENAVYLELRRLGYIVYTGSFRDKEVDFVAMKDDRVIYLQATYMLETAQTMEREYAPLLTIGDNYEKYVVSMDEVQFPSNEGVRHIQAWNLKEIL